VSRFSFIRREGIRREEHPLDDGEGPGPGPDPGPASGSGETPGDHHRGREEWWVSLSMHHTLDAP